MIKKSRIGKKTKRTKRIKRTKRTNSTRRINSSKWTRSSKPIKRNKFSKRKLKRLRTKSRVGADFTSGIADGLAWKSSEVVDTSLVKIREVIHQHWNRRFLQLTNNQRMEWSQVQLRGENYAAGFKQGAGIHVSLTPVPLQQLAAAVVCVQSDSSALYQVLSELETMPLHEIVVVLSQSTEGMYALARSYPNTLIVNLPEAVDADVGRAIGAKLSGADILLFVDGDHAVEANRLARFLWECDGRLDLALNDISVQRGLFFRRSGVERFHEFLNVSLKREDLGTNSLSILPFALSRRALDTLGSTALIAPVKAHAIAILKELKIGAGGFVGNPGTKSYKRLEGDMNKAAGDHFEAWREAMNARGNRLLFADASRNRSVLGDAVS